ncbi:Ionotropic receptor 252 [Blattella germanica]|nr:Ionotropic receptor 252 [Blattella germanica]
MAGLGTLLLFHTIFSVPKDLVRCITNIIYKHFHPGQTILTSLPTKGTQVDQILHSLHQLSLWPFHISAIGNEILDRTFEDVTKHQGYLIFTSVTEDDIIEDIVNQLEEIKMSPYWNPRARFLVVSTTKSNNIIKSMLQEMWNYYEISNVVVLVGSELYTWIPYLSHEVCTEVSPFVIDKCGKTSLNKLLLYREKIILKYHGCPLRVMPIETLPIYVIEYQKIGSDGKPFYNYAGVEIEYFKAVMSVLNFTVIYKPKRATDALTSRISALSNLVSGKVDIIFGGMAFHPKAFDLASPTWPIVVEVMNWYVPCGLPADRVEKLMSMFTFSVWGAIAVTFLVCSITSWQFSRKALMENRWLRDASSSFYSVWGLTLGVTLPHQPRSSAIRLLFTFITWYCFAVNTIFQTSFTSVLVNPGVKNQIKTLKDMNSSNLVYYFKGDMDNYLNSTFPSYYMSLKIPRKECQFQESCLLEYFSKDNAAIVGYKISTEYFLLGALPASSDIPQLCSLHETINYLYFAMYQVKGNPLIESFNFVIRTMSETGLSLKLERDVKSSFRYQTWPHMKLDLDEKYFIVKDNIQFFVFRIIHMTFAFYLLSVGLAISFLLLLGELIYHAGAF